MKVRDALCQKAIAVFCFWGHGNSLTTLRRKPPSSKIEAAAVVAIIPARFASTRLPGKPLAEIAGKPMIQHVYESVSRARGVGRVLVATDDGRIERAVRGFGGEVVLTSRDHASGTDRLAEAARKLSARWVVNVQGDLPFVRPQTIAAALRPLQRDPSILMGTVCTPIRDESEWRNPNVVKVVRDAEGFALYFSRAPIPFMRNDVSQDGKGPGATAKVWGYRHLGLYVYRREFLLEFARLRPAPIERAEGLEQLRALWGGRRIFVAEVSESCVEVDTPEDLIKAENYLRQLADGEGREAREPAGRTRAAQRRDSRRSLKGAHGRG